MFKSKDEIKDFVNEIIIKTAKDLLIKDGFVAPIVFVSYEDSMQVAAVQLPELKDYDTKRTIAEQVKKVVKQNNADAVIYVFEAFMKRSDIHNETDAQTTKLLQSGELRVSDLPDKEEAIIVTISSKRFGEFLVSVTFQRTDDGFIFNEETGFTDGGMFDSFWTDGLWETGPSGTA